jgi:DNA-binding Lrp family transcriptional regulator
MNELYLPVANLWHASSKEIHERFGLDVPVKPDRITIIATETGSAERLGGHYNIDIGELLLTQDVTNDMIPLQGVIYRECLYFSLPRDFCEESKHDLSTEFARQVLDKTDRVKWLKSWKTIPERRVRTNLVYNSFKLMEWIHNLGGNSELDSLIHEVECMFRYGKTLDFEEYVEYMIRRTQDIVVGLTQTDVKIIDALQKNESISYRKVAEISGLSESWVSTRINFLKKKYVLAEFTTTPFSRIGIRTFYVLLSGPSWDDPTRFIKGCPFLYEVRPILNGLWQVIARLAVPDNIENTRALDQMVSILTRNGIAVDVAKTYSVGKSNSFYHYKVKSHQWEIPWVAMEGWGHRIQEESLDQLIERIDYPAKSTDAYLDLLDLQILKLAHSGIFSTRALRKNLAISQSNLSERMKKLRSENLLQKTWEVNNIGLVERVALRATDKKTSGLLDAWSRELPRAFPRFEENRNLLLMAELPIGGSTRMMNSLRTLKWPVSVSPIGSAVWGRWEFPMNYWDVDRQGWIAPRARIDSWLNQISSQCENPTVSTTKARRHSILTR